MNALYSWLLEEKNPAVRYRTQKELLGVDADKSPVVDWITNKLPDSWYEKKGLRYGYYITAFAECGLSKEDIEPCYLNQALNHNFEWGCSNFMLLTSLVKLGFVEHEVIQKVIALLNTTWNNIRSCNLGKYLF